MMAVSVAGFARLASVVMSSLGGRQGMTLWYGLLGLRLVALLVASRPWAEAGADYVCNASLSDFCSAACFNANFAFPMEVAWDFSYLLALLPVGCLYMISPGAQAPPGRRSWSAAACGLGLALLEAAFLGVLARLQLPQVWDEDCRVPGCSEGPVRCQLAAWAEKVAALGVIGFASALDLVAGLAYAGGAVLAGRGEEA